jgi:hypothetical protein
MVTDPAAASSHFALSVEAAVTVSGRVPTGGAATRRNSAMTDNEWNPAGPASGPPAQSAASGWIVPPGPDASVPSTTAGGSASPSAPEGTRSPPAPEPGRAWGIVSLALSVIPLLQLVGLAAGVVGLVLSSRAGRHNGFAVAGIAVSLLILVAAGAFVVLFAFTGYDMFGGSVGSVVTVCSELGRGEHVIDGLSYTCR